MLRDHPMIEQVERHGYPQDYIDREEIMGVDYFQDEIWVGDKVIEDNGETILEDNLERYLVEVLGMEIKTL